MPDDLTLLEQALAEVGAGTRVPYLGAGVAALSGGNAPTTPVALSALIEAKVRVPRRAAGNLWSVAQYVESRRFRATLEQIVREAFEGERGQNPIHDWLARVRPPLIVDAWYDDALISVFTGTDWGWVQGVDRHGEWAEIWNRSYDSAGQEVPVADQDWKTLIYKPHGLARKGSRFLMSDSDYVEVLTEIDIQSPIPEEVQQRRAGRPFLFLGSHFDDQMLRIFARQIAKRSAPGHVAVIEGDLTRMERKFLEELGIRRIELPLEAVADVLMVPEG